MTDDLRWIPAQTYAMGSDSHYREESPVHQVTVDGFWIEVHQVTNAQFAEFISDTGYVTVAERPLDPADFPGAPEENLQPGSMVFTRTAGPVNFRHINLWWRWTPGASWRDPEGSGSSAGDRHDHPCPCRVRGCRGVRELGWSESADRGRMGGGRTGRVATDDLHLG
jgi:formylglycine-generating enzyme